MGFMNARRLILVVMVSLSSLAGGMLLAAPAALAGESCPNELSRQGPSINLPECRVYEQVTPVDKGDAIDLFQPKLNDTRENKPGPGEDRGFAAENGEAFLLRATASIGANAPIAVASYVFSRGGGGWNMSVVAPSSLQLQTVEPAVFDPGSLSAVGFRDQIGSAADLFADPSAFQRSWWSGPTGGPYAGLFSSSGPESFSEEGQVYLAGGSEDLSEVIFESENHGLVPDGPAEGQVAGSHALYERAGEQLRLVNVNSEGSLLSLCGAGLGLGGGNNKGGTAHSAVSSDGSKVFFTAPDPGEFSEGQGPGCWNKNTVPQENPPELYMRERGADGSFRTVEVSAPEPAMVGVDPDGMQPAAFVGAAANGSKVFFMTKTELTKDDTGHAPELYEYNTEPGPGEKTLTRISGGETGGEGNVDFVGAVSSGGSAVYFTAFGELVRGVPGIAEEQGNSYAPVNLYRYDTLTGKTTFVTTINEKEFPMAEGEFASTWAAEAVSGNIIGTEGRPETVALSNVAEWYTTGDGRYLVFGTSRPLTGFDNTKAPGTPACERLAESGGPPPPACAELYRYDAEAAEKHEQSIVCVSCVGGEPIDDAMFARGSLAELPANGPPRPISENGSDVFFETENALLPAAVEGREHVYEWHEGKLSMISSPSDPGEAYFLGSSADGKNVFFSTHAQLAAADTDVSDDIYDARVDGGFEGVTPSQCTGTGCQGVPAAPPIFATPASVTFEGVGNFPPAETTAKPALKTKAKSKSKKCRAGFEERHGKCMKAGGKAKKSAKGRK
jgi:hypothetical protein